MDHPSSSMKGRVENMSKKLDRRGFLKNAAVAAGAAAGTALIPSGCSHFAISGTKSSGRIIGANDTVRVCVAGIHGRGGSHIGAFAGKNGAMVTHLVDPDSSLFEKRVKSIQEKAGNTPKCYQDLREALDKEEFDVVTVAAPNQWHSLLGIWACQAGRDVYVEKPCSHNVYEGRKLVEAARKYKRMVQHGTQRRGSSSYYKQMAAIASGKYGKLKISYGYASKPRGSIGFEEAKTPPKELDFDIWLGPATQRPYHENLVHYNWHWNWDFGNGEIGNQGVHQMDVAYWAVNAATGLTAPKSVISMGGRFSYVDQAQTPNTQLTLYDFGETKLFFEDYGLAKGKYKRVTNAFFMEEGVIRGDKFYPNGSDKGEPLEDIAYNKPDGDIYENFINCVRSRKREELQADVLVAHHSSALCHLGNISYRLGRQVPFNKKAKALGGDKDSVQAFEDMKEHLGDEVKLDMNDATYCLGPKLKYDGKKEQFVGHYGANQLLTRPYRAPYVVPEKV